MTTVAELIVMLSAHEPAAIVGVKDTDYLGTIYPDVTVTAGRAHAPAWAEGRYVEADERDDEPTNPVEGIAIPAVVVWWP